MRRLARQRPRGPRHLVPAAHQLLDTGAELLHADEEVVECLHDAPHAGNRAQFVQHARDIGIGANQHAALRRHRRMAWNLIHQPISRFGLHHS